MLTLLTTTGSRPKAWEICQKLMARQTYKGQVRWIVVDDGEKEQEIDFKPTNGIWHMEIYRPEPLWQPGQNTQARNLLTGLAVIKNEENLVIIEDDDFYATDWLETVEQQLQKAELVGECHARYYNVKKRMGREMVAYVQRPCGGRPLRHSAAYAGQESSLSITFCGRRIQTGTFLTVTGWSASRVCQVAKASASAMMKNSLA